jgi:hypothetical protein
MTTSRWLVVLSGDLLGGQNGLTYWGWFDAGRRVKGTAEGGDSTFQNLKSKIQENFISQT